MENFPVAPNLKKLTRPGEKLPGTLRGFFGRKKFCGAPKRPPLKPSGGGQKNLSSRKKAAYLFGGGGPRGELDTQRVPRGKIWAPLKGGVLKAPKFFEGGETPPERGGPPLKKGAPKKDCRRLLSCVCHVNHPLLRGWSHDEEAHRESSFSL